MTLNFPCIAVIGSCVTQDALCTLGISDRMLAVHMARLSLASLTIPSPDTELPDPAVLDTLTLPAKVRPWLEAELTKTVPAMLDRSGCDILIIDLIEERFDLVMLASGVVVNASLDFLNSGLADTPAFAGARRIPRLSQEAWALWEAGLMRLRQWFIRSPASRQCRIILHRVHWASAQQALSGRLEPLPDATPSLPPPETWASRAAHQALLDRYHQRFMAEFPEAVIVEAPEFCIADPGHRWGPAPYHFVPAYYSAIAAQLHHHRVPDLADPRQRARIQLMDAARDVAAGTPLPGQSDLHPEWCRYLAIMASELLSQGPEKFLHLPSVRSTMFIGEYHDTARQLAALKALPDWEARWRPALMESSVGDAAPSLLHPPSSGNQIRQAYLLTRFEAEMGAPLHSFDQIIEFGGGFGALCHLIRRLGFRGRYTILDPQPVRALARWYLQENLLELAEDGVFADAGNCTLPNDALPAVLEQARPGRTAFLAHWSLSETLPETRSHILHALRKAGTEAIWIVYQEKFGISNSLYFAARVADFLNVYEATIRPLQPAAEAEDYFHGHACLALKKISGRHFPAASFETGPRYDSQDWRTLFMDDVFQGLRDAITAHTPFAAIRLGDGEGRIMGYPHCVPRFLVADIWNTWFGHTNVTDNEIAGLRDQLRDACQAADIIGVPQAVADLTSEFGRVKALLARDGFCGPDKPLTHAGFHLAFERDNRYGPLLSGLPRLGVIGPRDLTRILPERVGVGTVEWLATPPEMKFSDLPTAERAALIQADTHRAIRFHELMDRDIPDLLERFPGLVVLVGAGILGKIYCARIKALGGVAIDVGSMMDLWAGLKTRDNKRFDGLRLVPR